MFNRIQLWLNRSCCTPIHIHLSEGFGKGTQEQSGFASKLVTILRPHASFLRSLKVSGTEGPLTLQSLLSLYSIHGASGSLKILSVSGIRATDRRDIFDWPTNSLVGLVELDLANLGKFSCPSSDVISVILSNSPTLHTLRLRDLKIRPGPTLGHPDAHLPHLRLLEITDTSGEGLPLLIISLVPGTLELDVRLDFDIDWLDYYFESLLLRSNVTALSLHNISRRHRDRLKSHLCCTPGLRALLLKFTPFPDDPWALGELLVDYNLGSLLPHLHSLCLMHGKISKWFMGDLKRVLSAESLLKLVFVSCRFSLSLGELLESGDGVDENGNDGSDSNDGDNDNDDRSDEDDSDDDADDDTDDDDNSDGNNDDESEEYDKEMPESIKDWLNGAVENIFIFPDRPGQIYEGIDPFVEMLTELD
ncbi:hypothetical protein FS749_011705 [Ceratobasidium sp. UAMH 11750]|nr:hypothetical protein FS749_011705 [Ceratobasidium sp. UAMH 11750]